MPVTAKLSKAFYQQLGHEVTDELVDYLNDVDAAYRTDLRDLNELNFARFDGKLEQRITELRSTLREELVELRAALRQEIGELRAELKGEIGDLRTDLQGAIGDLRAELKGEIGDLRTDLTGEMGGLRTEVNGKIGDLRTEISGVESRLLRWMFAGWVTTIGTLITLLRLWG